MARVHGAMLGVALWVAAGWGTAAAAQEAAARSGAAAPLEGSWRAVLDLAGGPLRFRIDFERGAGAEGLLAGRLCNAARCDPFSEVRSLAGDSVLLDMADYAAAIRTRHEGDSLVGFYRNLGNRGPRTIPFRAARGTWDVEPPGEELTGRWDANFNPDERPSPRVIDLRESELGLEGTIVSNTGDYGLFWGGGEGGGFRMSHFDGSFVYMLTGRLEGDTLRGLFHAGARTQTPFVAVRSTGAPHLTPPEEVTRADTAQSFRFAFPDLDGNLVTDRDPRFQGKVVIVDIFGSWCPTCHDAAPTLVDLYRRYHGRGLEIVGLAYEVTGDPDVDAPLVRRYAEKFGIEFPLLLAGVNDSESPRASQPQLDGTIGFPTSIFLDRSGRVRRVHVGFYGPATGPAHDRLREEFFALVEELLGEG